MELLKGSLDVGDRRVNVTSNKLMNSRFEFGRRQLL